MLMGVTDYAAHRGVRLSSVQAAIAAGRIPLTEDNRIDVEVADQIWGETTHPSITPDEEKPLRKARPRARVDRATEAKPGISYIDARALREVWAAQRGELDLLLKRGSLVRADEVVRATFTKYRALRDALYSIPPRLAAQIAAESDELVVEELLEKAIRRVLDEFAESPPVEEEKVA